MLLFLPVGSQATRHHLHAFWGQVQAAATIMGSRERHGPLPQLGDLQAGATCCPGGGGGCCTARHHHCEARGWVPIAAPTI